MTTRANKQIWGLAEYLFNELHPTHFGINWGNTSHRDLYYDTSASLLKKINNNAFTHGDNHGD